MTNPFFSIVIPVYGCATSLNELYERLVVSVGHITDNFEIIMVNDAGPDNSWEYITLLAQKDKRVKGINLSRNFGQHYAVTAGVDFSKGDWIVVMDCDLQDQPEEIEKFYAKTQEGYDIVFGKRAERQDTFLKKLSSRLFFIVYNYFTNSENTSGTANFGIFSRKVIDNFKKIREKNRAFPLFIRWLGFKSIDIDIEHAQRKEGTSSYNIKRLFTLAFDSIISHSNKPLRLFIKLGFTFSFFSLLYGFYLIFNYFINDIAVAGWTTVVVSIYFIGGLLFANLGILGIYIGKIFNETKDRPLYIVQETTWTEESV